jgi:hypothetical protein
MVISHPFIMYLSWFSPGGPSHPPSRRFVVFMTWLSCDHMGILWPDGPRKTATGTLLLLLLLLLLLPLLLLLRRRRRHRRRRRCVWCWCWCWC